MASPTLNIGELEDVESNTFHTGTDLHTAAVNGDKLTIEKILKQDGDIDTLNKGDKYGRTALVYTVSGDWYECAEILVAHGASLLQTDCDKRNVLHWAAYLDRPKFIKLFLEHLGSNLEFNFGDKDGRTAFHYAAALANSKCLRLLLKRLTFNKRNLNTTDNEKMTALHWSVFYNRLENFKILLREGAETTKRDGKGRCLLHMAVLNPSADSVRIVRILLKHNRHFSIQFDCEKHTSLHLAVASGNQELVRELCLAEESALNCLDHLSRGVLHYAVLNNDIVIIGILISAGVSPHHVDSTGASVLHYAAKNNNAQIVKRFLECFKNFEDTSDNQGRTALMWAASEGSYDVLNLMLKNLSHFNIHASDEQGMTALHVACFAGHEECVKKLIANSADITQPDKLGQTALFKACAQGHHKIIDILMDRKGSHGSTMGPHLSSIQEESVVSQDTLKNSEWSHEPTEYLIDGGECKKGERENLVPIDKGAFPGNCTSDSLKPEKKNRPPMKYRINEKHPRGNLSECSSERLPGIHELEDENGCTPLHFAAHAGHTHVCSWLLREGVNPGKKDSQGRTALHGAAFNGHTECIALMLSHDPQLVNDCDYDGYSLLHHAASNGQLETVKLLVSETFQACLNARLMSTDWTPLDFAMAADHQDVTQFLMDNGALTTAWLQDAAADKIKKFLRRLVVRKHEATVKPLIERHKQLTKEEQLKHCENEDKIRNDDLIYGNMTHEDVAHNIVDDVTHDYVIHDDVTHGIIVCDVINKRNHTVDGHENDDDIEQQCTQETKENQNRQAARSEDAMHSNLRSEDQPLTTDHDQLRTLTENENIMHSDQKSDKNRSTTDDDHLRTFASLFGETEIRDNRKHILLLDACYHGDVTGVQKLLQENIDVNYRDQRGCTALHLAAAQGQDAICEYLLDNGAETRVRDINGRTALHHAAIAGNVSAVSLLLRHNKDLISYLDCDNRSALHYAASSGHLDAVKLLLDSRVQDVCAKSTQLTALDCAILGQHDDVNEYMISQGLQPSGLLDQAARVIQTNFRKSLERKGVSVESRGKPIKGTGKGLINNENKSKDGEISGPTVINNENPSKTCQEKTLVSVNKILSGIQTKFIYSTPKTDQKSRPTDCNPTKRLSENFSEGINSNYETDYDYSRTAVNNVIYFKYSRESRIKTSSSAQSRGTTFAESNVEKLSRAPDCVIVASGEKERIFQLRNNWERIALLRRKKQAALVIQTHFRKHLAKKKADNQNATKEYKTEVKIKDNTNTECAVISLTQDGTTNLGTDNKKNGTSLPSKTLITSNSPTKLSRDKTTDSDKAKESQTNQVRLSQNKVETSSGVYSNEPTSPKRLTRKTVVNRLRTTSPEYSSSENEPLYEKRQYKSAFPLLSPKSSATSSNRSPSNQSVIQLPNNRRPSHSNRRVEAPISPKSSSTSSNQSPSNAPVNQLPSNRRANSSPSNRRGVAPILSKNELVKRWLSDELISENASNTKTTNKTKNIEVEVSNSEPRLRKTDPSKGARRLSTHSARIRRNSLIKNAYGSPAALSYNFALDTYHPLVSRRGRKEIAFPFRTSSRVRPNSMKRVEVGWVRTADIAPGSTPSES